MSASFSTATAAMRVNKDFPTHLKAYEMGAQKFDVLMWCSDLGIPAVTLWVCSTENLKRSDAEISMILRAVETKIGALAQEPVDSPTTRAGQGCRPAWAPPTFHSSHSERTGGHGRLQRDDAN